MDIVDELKKKMLGATTPSWANRAIDEITMLRHKLKVSGYEAVVSDLKEFKIPQEKWIVYFPEGAPYAGIRTESGVTIAGTSSGLSEGDALDICTNRADANGQEAMLRMLIDERRKCESLRQQLAKPADARLIKAAKAVVERWETPLWKDAPATQEYIYKLRDALNAIQGDSND
jgi:hypothetical protein